MRQGQGRQSRPIVRIAIIGIILGVAVMICSASIVRGFRTGIRDKVVGFNAHLQVTDLRSVINGEDRPMEWKPDMVAELEALDGINEVRPYVMQGAILESPEGIEGVAARSIQDSSDIAFLRNRLEAGRLPMLHDTAPSSEILLSAMLCRSLDIELGDKVSLYFIRGSDDFFTRRLQVSGIYDTDLAEFDQQFVYVDIRHLQKIGGRGLEVQALVEDSCFRGIRYIEASSFGGDGPRLLTWSDGEESTSRRPISELGPGQHWVAVSDAGGTIADTAYFSLPSDLCDPAPILVESSGGSHQYYVNGYEVFLDGFEGLYRGKEAVKEEIGPFYAVRDIVERTPEIFSWLELLDVNIYIIIILMIGVAIINMSSALLILILERARMIGILKALGAADRSMQKVFLRHAGRLIVVGLFWGNLLGLGICLLQQQFPFIQLDPENYYLATVPITIDPWDILAIDLGTFLICLLAMMVPSMLVARISPVRAIRFD